MEYENTPVATAASPQQQQMSGGGDGSQFVGGGIAPGTDPINYYSSLQFFEVEKKIGKGQFSEVWRARNKVDGQIVALKKVQVLHLG